MPEENQTHFAWGELLTLQEVHNSASLGLILSRCKFLLPALCVCELWGIWRERGQKPRGQDEGRDGTGKVFKLFCIMKLDHLHQKRIRPDQWFSTGDNFAPLGDIWQCLETLLLSQLGMGGGRAIGVWWVEARMLLNILQCTGKSPQHGIITPNVSVSAEVLLHLSGQLLLKRWIIISVGESVAKREP